MIENFINSLLPAINNLGAFGYWVVFLIFFAEALVGIGLIIPGTIITLLLGALAGRGVFELGDLIIFASFGFLLGDIISYYLGTKGTDFFKNENKILKVAHLEQGQEFFNKHGNKSIFLGRFIGIVRPLIPFIAGLAKMGIRRFIILDVISILAWVSIHLYVGYFFGQAIEVIEAWSSRAEVLFLSLTAFFVLAFLLKWMISKKGKDFSLLVGSVFSSIGEAIKNNKEVIKLVNSYPNFFNQLQKRFTKNNFYGLPLTLLSALLLYLSFLFLKLLYSITTNGQITNLDQRIENLMHAFMQPGFIKFFLGITLFGESEIIIAFTVGISIFLWLTKKKFIALMPWFTVLGSGASAYVLKKLVQRQRPIESIYLEHSFSFPSAHSVLSVAFYGTLVYLLWRGIKTSSTKINALFAVIIITILIGFSRIYLNVHYLSDVLAGYLLGGIWLVAGIILTELYSNRFKPTTDELPLPFAPKTRLILFLIFLEILFVIGFGYHSRNNINFNKFEPASSIITEDILKDFNDYRLPKFSENLIGGQQEPINLIISADNGTKLIENFEKIGWKNSDRFNFRSLMKIIKTKFLNSPYEQPPVFQSFWQTEINDLTLEKINKKNRLRERHQIKIWKTNFKTPNNKNIYIAVATVEVSDKFLSTFKINPNIDGERELIFKTLKENKLIDSYSKQQFIPPTLGTKNAKEQFFTDGEIYIVDLR
ncbi:MAG: Phosphoesterase, PA-phosphatase related protein [Candidatus Falkowbacteria bacterium GW2011_GWF2_39_8]|uniref:Phosphoesterase, PA-phosphatase related protein n=1 Tax=Candidatus Falkowbacteria bacterium GW2011_GWF2_39_8 TaxID=1618642 RepID=A0A0G0Q5B1_9BACT|nr:MAG: Phosphoesterase, PA-phosphatase related protein [Candidatus Falkowbacteria bacterium GW2011_GWF2_39_8]